MSRFVKRAAVAAVMGLMAPGTASAVVTEVFNWSGCGGQNFASCATVVADYDDVANALTFTVTNTNANAGWPGVFTAVGWDFNINPTSGSESAPGGWTFGNNAQGIGTQYYGFGANAPPTSNGLTVASGTGTFTIVFAADPSFSSFSFALREQSLESYWEELELDCEGSNRLEVTKTGDQYTTNAPDANANPECFPDDPPTEIVPEPATMVLLATGLIGLAGAQIRRRKNSRV